MAKFTNAQLVAQLEQSHVAYQNLLAKNALLLEDLDRAVAELARAHDRTRFEVVAAAAKLKRVRAQLPASTGSKINFDARRDAAIAITKATGRCATGAEVRAYIAARIEA